MYTITVEDFIDDDYDDTRLLGCRIYIARDKDVIFYVGMSERSVSERVAAHLGLGSLGATHGPTELGQLIINHAPASRKWVFDFLNLADCEAITGNIYRLGSMTRVAEEDLIKHYQPYLNRVLNANGKELPKKYQRTKVDQRQAKARRPPGVYSYDLVKLNKVNGAPRHKHLCDLLGGSDLAPYDTLVSGLADLSLDELKHLATLIADEKGRRGK